MDRLLADGVDTIFDVYDLNEGSDKYAFMEQMVTDASVTHVLVFSDGEYARKADSRDAGVGVESQIISESIYAKVEQSKFIPIVCERDDKGRALLPVFMRSLIWIDFSSDQAVNASWEKLIRLVHGRPLHVKPSVGNRPAYLDADVGENTVALRARFASLQAAVQGQTRDITLRRADYLDSCIEYADELRVRQPPSEGELGRYILEDCRKLKVVRDAVVDWLMLEGASIPTVELSPTLVEVLERLLELKSRPPEITRWNDEWFGAQRVFVYETFLYLVASLLRAGRHDVLHEVFTTHYIRPESDRYGTDKFVRFDAFHGESMPLNQVLDGEGDTRYVSPAAELFNRQATRQDIRFRALIESELLVFLATVVDGDLWWYPGCLLYTEYGQVPDFFLRATRQGDFTKLGRVFGIEEAEELRRVVGENWPQYAQRFSRSMHVRLPTNLFEMMNIENLGTLR